VAHVGFVRALRRNATTTADLGVCHVWWARLDDIGPQHDALLNAAELERRSRLRRAADRRRLTAAAALARVVIGALLDVAPADVLIDRRCPYCGAQHGRPSLPASPDLDLSVSHSGDCVTIAISADGRLGVDVEEIAGFPADQMSQLADYVLAPQERADLKLHPADERAAAFTTYWTRKEAVVKATGEGLAAALDAVVVSPPRQPPELLSRSAAARPPMWLRALHPPPGFVATLAVHGKQPPKVVERDAGSALRSFTGLPRRARVVPPTRASGIAPSHHGPPDSRPGAVIV
jgi:4'-phosphopantetheinyl transferase